MTARGLVVLGTASSSGWRSTAWSALSTCTSPRPGSRSFVMDTRRCDAAVELARRVDLLVSESTYLDAAADLASSYRHLTAAQAAQIAAEAGVRRLVTHFSQRHPDVDAFADEARAYLPDGHAARDLDRVAVPPRL